MTRAEAETRLPRCGERCVERGGAHVTVITVNTVTCGDEVRSVLIETKNALGETKRYASIDAFEEWHQPTPPAVIVGRFGGPDAPEYTVAVGMRVVRIGVDPVVYPRRDATVTGFLRGQVVLTCDGNSVAWDLSRFWDEWRPAPPASRWLDPASVPTGPPMRVCSKVCPFPSRQPSGSGALCAYCASKMPFYASPRVAPSVLTPVPRWRTLSKERLYPSTPRVRRTILIEVVDAKSVVYRVSDPCPRPARVLRVHALDDRPGRDAGLLAAKWVRS